MPLHHQPEPRLSPPITIAWVTSRLVILHYTYWLTCLHSGNFRDVPLIEISVERGSGIKHCCKWRRTITFTVNAQEKKAVERTLIKILKQPIKDYLEANMFGIFHKEISQRSKITPLITNHRLCYKRPWEYTQSPAFFNTTSLPSLHYIINPTSLPSLHYIINTKPNPRLPPITIAWAHVTSRHELNLPHSSIPRPYHLYSTSSPPTQSPDWTLQSQ